MTSSRQNTSAIERLRELPPIFCGADLTTRFGWDSKTASQYLYLWKRGNTPLIAAFGGHSDVYANTLFHPVVEWEKALLMAMPTATIIGVEALRRAGWITQIPQRPDVAVRADKPVYKTDRFDIFERKASWFAATDAHVERGAHRAPCLQPAWALADLLAVQGWGKCGVWPDDIDWALIDEDQQAQWLCACQAFGIKEHDLLDWETDARQCIPGQPLSALASNTPTQPKKTKPRASKGNETSDEPAI